MNLKDGAPLNLKIKYPRFNVKRRSIYISFRRTVPLSGKSQHVQYQQNQLTVCGKSQRVQYQQYQRTVRGKSKLIQYQQYQPTYEKDMCLVPTMPSVVSHRRSLHVERTNSINLMRKEHMGS